MKKKLMAFALALLMVLGLLTPAFGTSEKSVMAADSGKTITVLVKDEAGNAVKNASVKYSFICSDDTKSELNLYGSTNDDGKLVVHISEAAVTEHVTNSSAYTFEAKVTRTGYVHQATSSTALDFEENQDVEIEIQRVKTLKVTYKLDGEAVKDGEAPAAGVAVCNNHSFKNNDKESIFYNTEYTLTVTANSGYRIKSLKVGNGSELIDSNDKTTFSKKIKITADTTVNVEFATVHVIKFKAFTNGVIKIDGENAVATQEYKYDKGTNSVTILATPNADYYVSSVKDNGTSVNFKEMLDENGKLTYVIKNITKDHEIEVGFAEKAYKVTFKYDESKATVKFGDTSVRNNQVVTGVKKSDSNMLKVSVDEAQNVHVKEFKIDDTTVGLNSPLVTVNGLSADLKVEAISKDTEISIVFEENVIVEYNEAGDTFEGKDNAFKVTTDKTPVRIFSKEGKKYVIFKEDAKVTFEKGVKKNGIYISPKFDFNKISFDVKANNSLHLSKISVANNEWRWEDFPCNVTLMVDTGIDSSSLTSATGSYVFADDFSLRFSATDKSGIQSVNYTATTSDGTVLVDNASVYSYTEGDTIKEGVSKLAIDVDVPTTENYYEKVTVAVTVTDRAGKSKTETKEVTVCNISPVLTLSYDNNSASTSYYYGASRTATFEVVTVPAVWNDAVLLNKLKATLKKDGELLANGVDPIFRKTGSTGTTLEGVAAEKITYTVVFAAEGDYAYSLSGLKNDVNVAVSVNLDEAVKNPYHFVIDTTRPCIMIGTEYGSDFDIFVDNAAGFSQYLEEMFDLEKVVWKRANVKVVAKPGINLDGEYVFDALSGLKALTYLKLTSADYEAFKASADKEAYLENKKSAFTEVEPSVSTEEAFLVIAKAEDKAGNVTYASTKGIVIDCTAPTVTPKIDSTAVNGIYNGNVNVSFNVKENGDSEFQSKIKKLEYKVWNYSGRENASFDSINDATASEVFTSINELEKNLKVTVKAADNNNNTTAVSVRATDNAGNVSVKTVKLKIDKTAPVVTVSYDNNNPSTGKYYNEARVAKISIKERNFTAKDVKITVKNAEGKAPVVSAWKTKKAGENGDDTVNTATITYDKNGVYTFDISYTDMAGNVCNAPVYVNGTTDANSFIIDMDKPEVAIEYNNNKATNVSYYDAKRTASIIVTEHNFNVADAIVNTTVTKNGNAVAAPEVKWTSNGDVHTGIIDCNEDGDYKIDIAVTDAAGNKCDAVATQEFTIDKEIPVLSISGVEKSTAYKNEIAPVISCSDINFDDYSLRLYRTRANDRNVDVTDELIAKAVTQADGFTINCSNFKEVEANDGVYTLDVTVFDKAGNKASDSITFTVNRFGSVYSFNETLSTLNNQYVQNVDNDLVITEYNANKLVNDSVKVEITRDGSALENVKFEVVKTGNASGWYQYDYVISAENFKEDGVYKVNVSSKDTANNAPETSNYEDCAIVFFVDTTAPEISSVTGLGKSTVNATELDVKFEVFDAIGLESLTVNVDGEEVGSFDNFENATSYANSVKLSSGTNQHVQIVLKDKAGNVFDTDAKDASGNYIFKPAYKFNRDVTVSTNMFVRLESNKTALYGIIAGVVVVVAAVAVILVVTKKKKNRVKVG